MNCCDDLQVVQALPGTGGPKEYLVRIKVKNDCFDLFEKTQRNK